MTLDRLPHHFSKTLLLASFSIGAIFVVAQTESNDDVSIAETEISEEFEILSKLELQTHQTDRYEKLKEELKKSQFSDEHQELIATALSQSVVGAPISTYREESFVEGTDVDPTEEVQTLSILETGMVEDDDASSYSLNGAMTPFSSVAFFPLEPANGKILNEGNSDITFRFDVILEVPEDEEAPEFVTNMLKKLKLAVDFKIDKESQQLKTSSFTLLKPFRKLFLFNFKQFNLTYNYEFNEDCGCMTISNRDVSMNASVLILGHLYMRAKVYYTDIECEKPLRYLHRDQGFSDDVLTLMF